METKTRGNKATRDKMSILADTKNLLVVLHHAIQRMPKVERIEGAPREMKLAAYELISHFTIAKECPEARLAEIQKMIGKFGEIIAAFDLSIQFGLFTDSERLLIAEQLERIEEGVKKWRNATRSPKSQAREQVWEQEALASND